MDAEACLHLFQAPTTMFVIILRKAMPIIICGLRLLHFNAAMCIVYFAHYVSLAVCALTTSTDKMSPQNLGWTNTFAIPACWYCYGSGQVQLSNHVVMNFVLGLYALPVETETAYTLHRHYKHSTFFQVPTTVNHSETARNEQYQTHFKFYSNQPSTRRKLLQSKFCDACIAGLLIVNTDFHVCKNDKRMLIPNVPSTERGKRIKIGYSTTYVFI